MTTGGVQGVVGSLADRLSRRGHVVRIVSLHEEDVHKTDAAVERIQLNCARNLSGRLACIRKLRQQIREFEPDVVHSHAFHANFFSALAVARIGSIVPLIRTVHSVREGGRLHAGAFKALGLFSKLDSVVSAAVGASQVASGGLLPGGYVIVRNGIDVDRFGFDAIQRDLVRAQLGIGAEERLLINVGRLTRAKDHALLLASFRKVLDDIPNVWLALVGGGELADEVGAQVAHLGLADRVLLLGERSEVPALLSGADLFALSSEWEGYPLCVLEARACGLPVVAFAVGGVEEALDGSGELVRERTPRAFAEGVRIQLGEPPKSRVVSDTEAKGISLDGMVSSWIGHYDAVVRSSPATAMWRR